jgi:heme exporter protein C
MHPLKPPLLPALTALTAGLLLLAITLVVQQVPNELEQGLVFKIFFFHVPAAWLMMLSAIVAAGGAVAALAGRPRGDAVVVAATELAVVFGTIVMLTGPIWAYRAWGKAWVWDARLTTSLVCWLTFAVLLGFRRIGGAETSRVGAALAIFGAANVPLVYFSVALWSRGMHPPTSVVGTLEPSMRLALWVSLAAFSALWVLLFALRHSQELAARELDAAWAAAAAEEDPAP